MPCAQYTSAEHNQQDADDDKQNQRTTNGVMVARMFVQKIAITVDIPHGASSYDARHLADAWLSIYLRDGTRSLLKGQ
jgi:hypothetical protein